MKSGYYFVKFKKEQKHTIGYYNDKEPRYPWEVIGSDCYFSEAEMDEPIKIEIPKEIKIEERK